MPKKIASGDLLGIYGDPGRAKAEGTNDRDAADAWNAAYWANAARTGFAGYSPQLVIRNDVKRNNAAFKVDRADAAIALGAIEARPVLWGLTRSQLNVGIVVGLALAAWLILRK